MSELRLRALEPGDLDCLYMWENSPEMWRYGVSQAPYSRHQLWEYIKNYDADPLQALQLRLMIDVGGVAVGSVDLYDIDLRNLRAYVGIMIAPRYRRLGYARKALKMIAEHATHALPLRSLVAAISVDNERSLSLFVSAGYEIIATLPGWVRCGGDDYADAKLVRLSLV